MKLEAGPATAPAPLTRPTHSSTPGAARGYGSASKNGGKRSIFSSVVPPSLPAHIFLCILQGVTVSKAQKAAGASFIPLWFFWGLGQRCQGRTRRKGGEMQVLVPVSRTSPRVRMALGVPEMTPWVNGCCGGGTGSKCGSFLPPLFWCPETIFLTQGGCCGQRTVCLCPSLGQGSPWSPQTPPQPQCPQHPSHYTAKGTNPKLGWTPSQNLRGHRSLRGQNKQNPKKPQKTNKQKNHSVAAPRQAQGKQRSCQALPSSAPTRLPSFAGCQKRSAENH